MKRTLTAALAAFLSLTCLAQTELPEPSGTYLYCKRDTCDLYLDFYEPSAGSETHIISGADTLRKPTILFVFGGGFKEGSRQEPYQKRWFKMLCDEGYGVVAIDYRLGLKDVRSSGVNMQFANDLYNAIQIAVEDLFDATAFLIDNKDQLGIDQERIVVSGASAGAITALQAEWEICNGHLIASGLPQGFHYAGVMAFSGSVYSREGAIKYASEPCPHFLCHGTDDKMVPYGQIALLKMRFGGTDIIAKTFAQNGYNYQVWRFKGNTHEIAASMMRNFPEELRFLEENVVKGRKRIIDATISDPGIKVPSWAGADYKDLYK